ncbi:MAG: permease-like cell division protein FtsX [Kofleriaceae bacterium]|nr:permease-like cell division protein FtsX [Kofleriaceae bacterium]
MISRFDPDTSGPRRFVSSVWSVLRRTARVALERPRAALWTLLALTCALVAVGVAAIAADNVDRWASHPGSSASMVVYLGEGIDDARAQGLVAELRELAGVEHAELVGPEESARRLQLALGGDATLLEGVDIATLPSSVEVTLAPGVRDVVTISPTVRALRGAPGVEDVIVESGGNERLLGALYAIRYGAWGGAALFAGLALIIVLAAIRVRLDRSRDELAVAHLLGAGPSFLVIPTALAGAMQGALAALCATGVLWAGISAYGVSIAARLSASLGAVALAVPSAIHVVLFVAVGAGLGLVGGALAGASRVTR